MTAIGTPKTSSSSSSSATSYRPPSRAYSSASSGASEERPSAASKEFLILLALIFHIIDAFVLRFEINSATIVTRALMYIFLAIMTHFMIKEHNAFGAIKEYGLWASISIFFIPIFYYFMGLLRISQDFQHNISAVILAIPMYILYLMYFKGFNHDFYKGMEIFRNIFSPISWAKIWFIVLVFLMIFSATVYLPEITDKFQTQGISAEEGARNIGALFSDTWNKLSTNVGGIIPTIKTRYDELWNSTMGERYTGQVEDEYKNRANVEISNFETMSQKFYEGVPISFFPIVNARSFGNDRLELFFNCTAYDSKNKSNIVKGLVYPASIYVERYDDVGVRCDFNTGETNRLKDGNYRVEFTARFGFETWAYTTYAFMERNYANSIRAGGDDLNSKFNIPRKPETPIYTGGPVMLGMNQNINLPITLDYQTGAGFPIGMTLENKNPSEGEIINVKEFRLYVPSPILINPVVGCSHQRTGGTRDPDTGYNIYSFKVPANAPKQSYLTITCSMSMTGLGVDNLLSDPNGVTGATIMGQTEYDYLLKKRLNIKVEKDPYYQYADPIIPNTQ